MKYWSKMVHPEVSVIPGRQSLVASAQSRNPENVLPSSGGGNDRLGKRPTLKAERFWMAGSSLRPLNPLTPRAPFRPRVPFIPGIPSALVVHGVLEDQALPALPGGPGSPFGPLAPGSPSVPFRPGTPMSPFGPWGPGSPIMPFCIYCIYIYNIRPFSGNCYRITLWKATAEHLNMSALLWEDPRWRRAWQPCCELRENSAVFHMLYLLFCCFTCRMLLV